MDALALLRKYQELETDGSPLGRVRTNREYAVLLGIHESQLSRCFDGQQGVGPKVLRGLRRAFPSSAAEVAAVFIATLDDVADEAREAIPA